MSVNASFTVKCLLLMSWAQFAFSGIYCDRYFPTIAGPIEEFSNDVDHELVFQRKGGEQCKCSFVSVDCRVSRSNYTDCSDLVIDGRDAALNGYPVFNLRTYFSMCNFDNHDWMKLDKMGKSKAEIYYNTTNPMNPSKKIKKSIFQESFMGKISSGGLCKERAQQVTFDTARAKYYMEAQLVGFMRDEDRQAIENGACYAYAYKKIDFKYDYGQGQCNMNTEVSCMLIDGSNTCKEHINSIEDLKCTPFEAIFTATACNKNARDVYIQQGASNYKINTYERNEKDGYIRSKERLPGLMKAGTCETYETRKMVNPCEKNFWQIRIQGSVYNEDAGNGWVFQDKDCKSFAFDSLPVADECLGRADVKGTFLTKSGWPKTCEWVGSNGNKEERCAKELVPDYCPITCGICPLF